jgi:hypothetical protein
MATDSGDNTSEVKADLEVARANGQQEVVRYLERVLEDRKLRKASVTSTEIVLGNKDAYDARTVEQQEQLAEGRPVDPVKFEDLGVRGAVDAPAGDEDEKPAPKRSPRS